MPTKVEPNPVWAASASPVSASASRRQVGRAPARHILFLLRHPDGEQIAGHQQQRGETDTANRDGIAGGRARHRDRQQQREHHALKQQNRLGREVRQRAPDRNQIDDGQNRQLQGDPAKQIAGDELGVPDHGTRDGGGQLW
jgi:hypothetical protein